MSEETVFHKIVTGDIPSDKVYEDEKCLVIKDINPSAPVHLLCIPKEYIRDFSTLTSDHEQLLGHLFLVASKVSAEMGIAQSGYRIVVNCGEDGGMEIPYLHIHILGGKKLPALG